jgi:argonaute-like protein implicated in RNA metabolism and viral defense
MIMFNTGATGLGPVSVMTSNKGGLSNDQISEMATNKIVYVSEDSPEEIRIQAEAFKDKVRNILQYYVELARREERATICAKVREAGQLELADAIRRI